MYVDRVGHDVIGCVPTAIPAGPRHRAQSAGVPDRKDNCRPYHSATEHALITWAKTAKHPRLQATLDRLQVKQIRSNLATQGHWFPPPLPGNHQHSDLSPRGHGSKVRSGCGRGWSCSDLRRDGMKHNEEASLGFCDNSWVWVCHAKCG